MTDRIFNGRYRLDRTIGEGGTATVFAGTDTVLRRRVAIKVLRPQFATDQDFVDRFFGEARHAAKLSHPNVVNVHDVGREGETYFIVMELVEGSTLAEIAREAGRLPEPVAIDYAIQICAGLAYAHRQGILHRDVKPANVLVTRDDVVKISDFGIARAVTAQTIGIPATVMGSVSYISPEQAQGHDVRETADLYSLGVSLYQMLAGRLPFEGDAPVTIAMKHVSDPAPSLAELDPPVSPGLRAIVDRLLEKDPAARFVSATDVARALREAREAAARAAPPPTLSVGEPTIVMPTIVPNPPPRASRYPDRPRPEPDGAPVAAPVAPPAPPAPHRPGGAALVATLALVFAIAGGASYSLFSNRATIFGPAKPVTAANEVGRDAAAARAALERLGFVVTTTAVPSETVPRGRVLRQSVAPQTKLPRGSAIALVVSDGPPQVDLIDLSSYSAEDARRYLKNAHLRVALVSKFDASAKGTVLSQTPKTGAHVPVRTLVTLVVSAGAAPVAVPDLVTMTLGDATRLLETRGLKVGVVERTASDDIPPNVVTSQNPAPATKADAGTTVGLTVSSGPEQIPVPDVGGKSVDVATRILRDANLTPRNAYLVQTGDASGTVVQQDPPSAAAVRRGAVVTLSVAVPGSVPDVTAMTLAAAKTTLAEAGYAIGSIAYGQEGDEGKVIRTEPAADTPLRPGESVIIHVSGTPSAP